MLSNLKYSPIKVSPRKPKTRLGRAFLSPLGILLALLLSVVTLPAQAHSLNESYIFFNVSDTELSGRIEVNSRDLARVFSIAGGEVEAWSREEIDARRQDIFDYFDGRMLLQDGERTYSARFTDITFLEEAVVDGSEFAQLQFEVPQLTQTPETIEMSYDFMFSDIDPDHRGLALVESNSRTGVAANGSYISLIFEPGDGFKTLHLDGEPTWEVFKDFVIHGVWHIWLGFDHVLFLITLLLTSVMVISASGRWEPAPSLRDALRSTLIIVTVFTLAHSITLGLAAFSIVTLPVVLVEAIIALSIAFVALGNMFARLHLTSWKVILVFGLFHGLGFANVLAPPWSRSGAQGNRTSRLQYRCGTGPDRDRAGGLPGPVHDARAVLLSPGLPATRFGSSDRYRPVLVHRAYLRRSWAGQANGAWLNW